MSSTTRARRASAQIARIFSLAVLLIGIAFAAWACVQWLETAKWQPLTVNGALASWPTTREWVDHPRSWLGLHRVIAWFLRVPIFLIVTLTGIALVFISAEAPLDREKRARYY